MNNELKPPVPGSNPGTGFLEINFFFKRYKFFTVCVSNSAFVLLTLLIPGLCSSLSNRFCRCAGIVLHNGCQVADRVTDVCVESIIHGITSEIRRAFNNLSTWVRKRQLTTNFFFFLQGDKVVATKVGEVYWVIRGLHWKIKKKNLW